MCSTDCSFQLIRWFFHSMLKQEVHLLPDCTLPSQIVPQHQQLLPVQVGAAFFICIIKHLLKFWFQCWREVFSTDIGFNISKCIMHLFDYLPSGPPSSCQVWRGRQTCNSLLHEFILCLSKIVCSPTKSKVCANIQYETPEDRLLTVRMAMLLSDARSVIDPPLRLLVCERKFQALQIVLKWVAVQLPLWSCF